MRGVIINRTAHFHMINRTLDGARKGKYITVLSLPEGVLRVQLIRLGITIGDKIFCVERLPGGTVVIQKNRQEIALGYELARQISISEDH